MKVILYMTITVDGYIAKTNGETPWSNDEWNLFNNTITSVGALIVGRVTYDLMNENGTLDPFNNIVTIIVTSNPQPNTPTRVFVKSPEEAITCLAQKGFKTCIVAGGSSLNKSFIRKKLVHEVYLDIEPHIFGEGITLFDGDCKDVVLELKHTFAYGKSGIALRYKVIT